MLSSAKKFATVAFIVLGLVPGLAVFATAEPGAEAVLLSEVKKLLAADAQPFDFFGYSVAVSGGTAIVGAYGEDAAGSLAGAAYVFEHDRDGANNWGFVKKLTAGDAEPGDQFAFSLALEGDTAVVGACCEDAGGSEAGAAYVFRRDQGGADNWGEVKKLAASDAQAGDHFGYSVGLGGGTAVVGALDEGTGGDNAGAAYVFERDEGGADNWGQVAKLTASDAEPFDEFGHSVAISGDTAVVGAHFEHAGGNDAAGAAYVFGRDQGGGGNWGEVKKLIASDAEPFDEFGHSVAVSDDVAVVGAHFEDAGGNDAGAAYVFGRDQGGVGNWGEVRKLTASDAQAGDQFGFSVGLSGDVAVVGALLQDAGATDAGGAYLFRGDKGGADSWGEVEKLIAADPQTGGQFGHVVAASAAEILVGAPGDDNGGAGAGAAYVFQQAVPTTTPTETKTPTATPEPCAPEDCPVEVVAELPQTGGALQEAGPSKAGLGVAAGSAVAVAAGALVLGGAAWFLLRRSKG